MVFFGFAAGACDRHHDDGSPTVAAEGEVAHPPFAVRGDCKGLLLEWYDADGVHTAATRADIPEGHRERVRVESLTLAPEDRLDPDLVYVADLRAPSAGGSYPVRVFPRHTFDTWVEKAAPGQAAADQPQDGNGRAILYGATWCAACQQATRFFHAHGVPLVVKDIDQDPSAAQEMRRKARQAGVSTSAIPLIDYRGTVMSGFDPQRLEQLMNGSPRTL